MSILLLVAAALGACPDPGTSAELIAAEEQALAAMEALDANAFLVARDASTQAMDCMEELLTPAAAASYHRTRALAAFSDGDSEAALLELRAAAALEPGYRFPEAVAPAGGELAQLQAQALSSPFSRREPAPGLFFDGVQDAGRPVEVPTVMQRTVADAPRGAVVQTVPLRPGMPLPPPPSRVEASAPPPSEPPRGLAIGAGAAALGAGALWAVSASGRAAYDDLEDPVPTADLPALRTRTNASAAGAAALGAAALGMGVGVVLRW